MQNTQCVRQYSTFKLISLLPVVKFPTLFAAPPTTQEPGIKTGRQIIFKMPLSIRYNAVALS